MDSSLLQMEPSSSRRVAVIPRLIVALSYSVAALGASLSALLLSRVLEAMRDAETAGIGAVTGGIAEANVPVLVSLYLAIAAGFVAIIVAAVRAMVETTTASPPAWFYFAAAAFSFLSIVLLWITESILIPALYPGSAGIMQVAATIQTLALVTMVVGPVSAFLLLIASVLPIKSKSRTQWPGILMLVASEIVLIAAAIAFQMRTSWLWRVMEAESFG